MKPIRKYATRDLEILSRRGNSHAQNELIKRDRLTAARTLFRAVPVAPVPVSGPVGMSPGRVRREERRIAEGKYVP